ncbi:NAD(P)H-hydrate epimerase [Agromyces mariniharenae]|uniref:NAD(P)H-hydrate epimerase n=1 Tax=Agromyces mariniharenae TaxID=2604423 RepID=A0A5S4V022_9MICO|nr:NAD(P)H-hydrate epimerase [Agromyces mariniharenae]TYL51113.1 NAD(P)H-hydrate epimerase [Agromyces mariniharenae]
MLVGYSAAQVRAAEAPHLAAGEPLMRRAAAALAATLRRELAEAQAPEGPVVLLVGSGDNGGDALWAGAELAEAGVVVTAVPTSERMHAEGAAAAQAAGVRFVGASDDRAAEAAFGDAAVIVDGILGTGTSASPALRGRARDLVAAAMPVVEAGGIRVVAVDLPSGIHPDDGTVPDPTVLRADITVTFGAVKAGLLREPAAGYAGRIELVDLGLGPELATMAPLVTLD